MPLIYSKITEIMADIPTIEKNRRHQQGYQYRGIDDFFAAFQPVLQRHGVFLVPDVIGTETGLRSSANGKEIRYCIATVAYNLFAEDGSMIRATVIGEAESTSSSASNKAMSDALKIFLSQVFCIPADTDADAKTNHDDRDKDRRTNNTRTGTQQANSQNDIAGHLNRRAQALLNSIQVTNTAGEYSVADGSKTFTASERNCTCLRFLAAQKCEHTLAIQQFRKQKAA